MRYNFKEGEGISSLLINHGTELERFTPEAIHSISDSFNIAKTIRRPYASVADLLIRLGMDDEPDTEDAHDIMHAHGLTPERISPLFTGDYDTLPRVQKLAGVEQDFRILLVSLDYYSNIYPGLDRSLKAGITNLDLLHNALMWTKDSARLVVDELRVNPEQVINECRARRWQNRLPEFKLPREYSSDRSSSTSNLRLPYPNR